MKSFDAIEINDCTWQPHSDDYYRGYEAGQQSKQAEVDELRKRIDDCIKAMDDSICDIDCGTIYGILTGDQS